MSKNKRPNIILISIDCARADHFSCYGHNRRTTPFIDKLTEEGVLFEKCISPAAWTLPSHASMFTGLYPSTHRADDGNYFLDNTHQTLAEALKNRGYLTLGYSRVPWVSSITGLSRGFQKFEEYFFKTSNKLKKAIFLGKEFLALLSGYRDAGAKRVNNWAKSRLKEIGDSSPFFLFLHYWEPHTTYRLPRPDDSVFFENSVNRTQAKKVNQDYDRYIAGEAQMSEEDFDILKRLYDSTLYYVDKKINDLVNYLKQLGLLEQTIIIITGDHGDNLGEHKLMGHKLCLYDTLLRVPMIVRYPSIFPRGSVVSQLVQSVDIFPTIMEILNINEEKNYELQGLSLTSLLNGAKEREYTISEQAYPNLKVFETKYPKFDTTPYRCELKALRTKEYKYIWHSNGNHELFHLKEDPKEEKNLIDKMPENTNYFKTKLEDWIKLCGVGVEEKKSFQLDENIKDQLRQLGYFT